MGRVTVSVDDSMLSKVDEEAEKQDISRSQVVSAAIESHITGVKQSQIQVHNLELELNKSQTEVMQLKRQITKLENQQVEKDKVIESKGIDVTQIQEKLNQSYADVNHSKQEIAKFESALKSKEDEIVFLRGHVSLLTQSIGQLAIKPGEEEAKKKGWWQFWK